MEAMIVVALGRGDAAWETLKMRWEDLDFLDDVIAVVGTHTKTQQERLAPLSNRVVNLSRTILEVFENGLEME